MTIQEKIDAMTAFRDGKEIEFRIIDSGKWIESREPNWDFTSFEYRIKPEPRRIWINEYPDGLSAQLHPSQAAADNSAAKETRIRSIEFVEVLK